MAEIAFRYVVRSYKAADLGAFLDAGHELTQRLRRELPMSRVNLLDVVKSDNVLTARSADDVVNPTKTNGTNYSWRRLSGAGAAAGNHTITGLLTTDVLVAVMHSNDTTHVVTDLTSEYTISATDTINNTAGTTSVGSTLVVIAYRPITGTALAAV